jgi:hypothetical protein
MQLHQLVASCQELLHKPKRKQGTQNQQQVTSSVSRPSTPQVLQILQIQIWKTSQSVNTRQVKALFGKFEHHECMNDIQRCRANRLNSNDTRALLI